MDGAGVVASMTDEMLGCRDLRHAWARGKGVEYVWTETDKRGRAKAAERRLTCTGGCGTVRVERFVFLPGGRIEREGAPIYRYADGFLFKAGDGSPRPSADVYRAASIARQLPEGMRLP